MVDNMSYIVLYSLLIGSALAKPSGPGSQGLNCADAEYYGYEDTEGCDFNEAYYDYKDFLAREEVYLICIHCTRYKLGAIQGVAN